MDRITDAMLDSRVETVNVLLGFDAVPAYSTDGSVVLGSAYGSIKVEQYVGDLGGTRYLSGLGTKRETYIFLGGMISALRIAQGERV